MGTLSHKTTQFVYNEGRNVSIPRANWPIMTKTPIQQAPEKQPKKTYPYPLVIIRAFSISQI